MEATPPRHSKTEHAARFATTVQDTRQRCQPRLGTRSEIVVDRHGMLDRLTEIIEARNRTLLPVDSPARRTVIHPASRAGEDHETSDARPLRGSDRAPGSGDTLLAAFERRCEGVQLGSPP